MGQDKCRLKLGGKTLLEWVAASVRAVGIPLSILREDRTPGLGPLGGIQTACLDFSESRLVFFSCDMPFVGPGIIDSLIRLADSSSTSVICDVDGRLGFPFLFCVEQLPVLNRRLADQRRSVVGLAGEIPCRSLQIDSEDVWKFCNINTPEDLKKAEGFVERVRGEGENFPLR